MTVVGSHPRADGAAVASVPGSSVDLLTLPWLRELRPHEVVRIPRPPPETVASGSDAFDLSADPA
jgi:hypothetical protein